MCKYYRMWGKIRVKKVIKLELRVDENNNEWEIWK